MAAQDLPSTMVLGGQVVAGPVTARVGDQVLVFSAVDGQLIGSGPVHAAGEYATILTRSASFNGSPLIFELLQGNRRYALLPEGVAPPLRFRGKLLPERSTLALRVGVKTAELTAGELENLQAQRLSRRPELPCMPELDVDGDGKCDARDWDILRLYGGGMSRSVAHPD